MASGLAQESPHESDRKAYDEIYANGNSMFRTEPAYEEFDWGKQKWDLIVFSYLR